MIRPASLRLALAAGLVAATASAGSAQTTWNFGDTTAPGACSQTSAGLTVGTATRIGNVYECSQQPSGTTATLRVTGFSAGTALTTVEGASVTPQGGSGFGVGSLSEGGGNATSNNGVHALDNIGGLMADGLLLQFLDGPRALTGVTLGWTSVDADFQVLRWIGGGSPLAAGASLAGWQVVNAVNGQNDGFYAVNAGGVASSYWAVSAYNQGFGAVAGLDAGDDRFKVQSVSASAVVPEPSTYALLAAGLAGIAAAARRRRSA